MGKAKALKNIRGYNKFAKVTEIYQECLASSLDAKHFLTIQNFVDKTVTPAITQLRCTHLLTSF